MFELQGASLNQIDEAVAAAEATTDTAEKILKLQDLQHAIQQGQSRSHYTQEAIIAKRTDKKYLITGYGGSLGTMVAIAVPVAILAPPLIPLMALSVLGTVPAIVSLNTGRTEKKKRKQLAEQNPGLGDFAHTLAAREERVAEMLDETVKSCDFEQMQTWLSPYFGRALDDCIPLRERFAQAVIDGARQANEEKAAQQEQTRVSKKLRLSHRPPNA